MDINNLKGLMEAYQQVNAPEQIDEVSRADEFTRAAISRSSGRKGGITFEPGPNWDPSANRGKGAHLSPKQKEKQRRKALRQEQLDIFDIVLEFLQVEGYAETLEEAEWMMANLINEEAIAIILGEEQLDEVSDRLAKAARNTRERRYNASFGDGGMSANYSKQNAKKNMLNKTLASRAERTGSKIKPVEEDFELWVNELVEEGYDLSNYTWDEMYEFYLDEDAGIVSGLAGLALGAKGASYAAKHSKRMRDYPKNFVKGMIDPRTYVPKKKQQKEAFEAWLDEAMTNYEKNRKRAAQRAAARNDARAQGKTGAVPGVGYVTPRKERETWTDESGKTRHAKGL